MVNVSVSCSSPPVAYGGRRLEETSFFLQPMTFCATSSVCARPVALFYLGRMQSERIGLAISFVFLAAPLPRLWQRWAASLGPEPPGIYPARLNGSPQPCAKSGLMRRLQNLDRHQNYEWTAAHTGRRFCLLMEVISPSNSCVGRSVARHGWQSRPVEELNALYDPSYFPRPACPDIRPRLAE